MIFSRWVVTTLLACCGSTTFVSAQTLEARLLAEPPTRLAADARDNGDPRRGAIVFFQPFMSCRQCHNTENPLQSFGPDLARPEKPATDAQLVDAVLRPSQEIRKGFESMTVLTVDGRTIVGLVANDGDPIKLRDPSQPAKLLEFSRDELEAIVTNKNSLMPQSLVTQLSSRQQFLDLIAYLIEIRDGGPLVARNLQPAPHLYAARPLPDYEQSIDHAGMIADLGPDNLDRGREIYDSLCANCHGTHDKPGSLPTSLRFASGQFKNGNDPFTMYQTLTRGFGMMQPQSWMVPQQKYDVIHYIRNAYLKPHNPSQYFSVDPTWLASLPQGDSRGPEPQNLKEWMTMDYGPALINTYEIGSEGDNFAYKGIAVRLDEGPGGVARGQHWMIFDHDTLRMAAAWSGDGFVDWNGIHFNGQHNIHPRIAGTLHAQNKTGPGWANPNDGSWDDTRLLGRDDRHYGPLPREWAHYEGMHYHGDRVVISYRVGTTQILESPRLLQDAPTPVYARQMQLGPRERPLTLQLAQLPATATELQPQFAGAVVFGPESTAIAKENEEHGLRFDGATHAQLDEATDFDMTESGFTISARIRTKKGGTLFAKTAPGPRWVPDGKAWFVRGGRLAYDIGWVGALQSRAIVDDGKWHNVALTWNHQTGIATLFVDGNKDNAKRLRPKTTLDDEVVRIGFGAPDFPAPETHFLGEIDSLRFFNRELSASDLAAGTITVKPIADWNFAEAASTLANRVADRYRAVVLRGDRASPDPRPCLVAGIIGLQDNPHIGPADLAWSHDDGALRLTIPAGDEPLAVTLWVASIGSPDAADAVVTAVDSQGIDATGLDSWLQGGPGRLPEVLTTTPVVGSDDGSFAVDVLSRPAPNPWAARVRLTGFDFFDDGDSAAVCSWDGDVWKVSGIDSLESQLNWQRIATGLFQPLGVRIVAGVVYVTCRDQIVILQDHNGDGEIDFYQNFNNDHQVTEHFHEFAMGLQTDEAGNFYYAKSARHALEAVVPHHGTLLRVSKDGTYTDIVANGFRAANGVCLNPDGTFIVTDQEGHWNPKNRINWVREGGFYGNMFGYHDVSDSSDSAMQQPLCWITNEFDRSPAELLWVPQDCWGPLGGSLLNLSYGYGKVFVVPHEHVDGQVQGGMCELPLPQFPTGLVRGRFHPTNGHLYTCGMFAWAGNQQQPGGFYRIRATGKPMHLPVGLHAHQDGVTIRFTDPFSPQSAQRTANYSIRAWDLKRTANYGSKHYNERTWRVSKATLSGDGKSVTLKVPEIAPTWGMEIRCFLETPSGEAVQRRIHNTIHRLQD
jgi:putative heme-binding domain-containing protein